MSAEFDWMHAMRSSPILMVLVGCSLVTLATVVERAIYFWKRRGDPDATLKQALDKIAHGSTREAAWACESTAHPFGRVARQVFEHKDEPAARLEERMQVALSGEKLLLERGINIMGTMAAVAPLIGLLGTVWGIMRAFRDMAAIGSAAPSVVAAGVAEALVTTAGGLIVAVPAVVLYNHFSRRMNVMLTVAENHSRTLRAIVATDGQGAASTNRERTASSDDRAELRAA